MHVPLTLSDEDGDPDGSSESPPPPSLSPQQQLRPSQRDRHQQHQEQRVVGQYLLLREDLEDHAGESSEPPTPTPTPPRRGLSLRQRPLAAAPAAASAAAGGQTVRPMISLPGASHAACQALAPLFSLSTPSLAAAAAAAAAAADDELCVTKVEPPSIQHPLHQPPSASATRPHLAQILQSQAAPPLQESPHPQAAATTAISLGSFAIPAQLQTAQGLITVNLLISPHGLQPTTAVSANGAASASAAPPGLSLPSFIALQAAAAAAAVPQTPHPTIARVQSMAPSASSASAASSTSGNRKRPSAAAGGGPAAPSKRPAAAAPSADTVSYHAEKEQLYRNLLRVFEKARNRGARLLAEVRQVKRCVLGNEALIGRLVQFAGGLQGDGSGGERQRRGVSPEVRAELLRLLAEARGCIAEDTSGGGGV